MKFRALIEGAGKSAAGIEVPAEVVAALGHSKRPPVRVTINGHTYRSTVAVLGGRFMLGVSNEVRANAGVAAGDEVEVAMELDTAPREVAVPPELARELAGNATARKAFDALSYSKQRLLVDPVANAKTAETRDRNIAKALSALRAGRS
ncbi:MAG TPA: YdeI/OmpD-associated family protein [Candidatus Limnocylindria bacterium]|nr:YdeI/OmpD-associated family protein [Candidatus Limnocylindria bacterium]